MKRTKAIAIIVILVVAAISVGIVLQFVRFDHNQITISNNQDFEDQGWTGSGTKSDPYVLSGYRVHQGYVVHGEDRDALVLAEASIIIANTTSHFVITNCEFLGDGIKLDNVETGIIEHCDFGIGIGSGSPDFGIEGSNVRNCTIRNNLFYNCNDYCVKIENGNSNTISENTITSNDFSRTDSGIYLSEQSLLNCRSNTISNCSIGIELYDCSGGVYSHWVSNNFIEECRTGMNIVSCSNLPMYLNELYNNTIGLEIYDGIGVTFGNNSVTYNSDIGVWMRFSCVGCIVANNDISSNGWAGILFDWIANTTHLCTARNNTITNNDGWGIIVNGMFNVILESNTFSGNTQGNIGNNISYVPCFLIAVSNSLLSVILENNLVSLESIVLLGKQFE